MTGLRTSSNSAPLRGAAYLTAKATGGPLAKVASSLDYIERARTVVRIASEAPVGDVDTTFPQHPPDSKLIESAEANGVSGPMKRLTDAMKS